MRVVTWNVNSIRARLERVVAFLKTKAPDVLCVQETKVEDASFPRDAIEASGYEVDFYGQKTYNGVAFLRKRGVAADDLVLGMPDEAADADRRVITATIGGLRIINAYVVNGQEVGSEKYAKKLRWLLSLKAHVAAECSRHGALVLCGDFNIAPDDRDVYDPAGLAGTILLSEPERKAFQALLELGLSDLHRAFHEEAGLYTWWDYRGLGFPKNRGFRIDLFLGTRAARERCTAVTLDREERKGKGASDHIPVIAEFR